MTDGWGSGFACKWAAVALGLASWLGALPATGQDRPAAGPNEAAAVVGYEFSFPAMGTKVQLRAFHHDRVVVEAAFEAAQRRVEALEQILSDYRPESETRTLTARAYPEPATVSPELFAVLETSQAWYRRTDGAFDASLGALTKLWRKHRRAGRVPSGAEIEAALERCGWEHVELLDAPPRVRLRREGIEFDFGGIGKGFVLDQVFELLQQRGLTRVLVDISGNMRCGQPPPGRAAWRIGIAPLKPGQPPLRLIHLVDRAIATSGDLWQYVEVDGRRYSHILSPQTGRGVLGPIAATVIAERATDADALATAACVLGFERAAELSHRHGLPLLVAEIEDGVPRVRTAGGFPEPLEPASIDAASK